MLFSRGDLSSVGILWTALTSFGDVSGLRTNALKSQIFMAEVQEGVRDHMVSLTGISLGTFPVRYLGVPLAAEGLRVIHYAPLLEQIAGQIGLWTASSLSHAGRLELIRSVLQGIHCFWLSTLPVPMEVIDRVTRLCRRFLWDDGKPLVAWHVLGFPKEEGGADRLGYHSLGVTYPAQILIHLVVSYAR